MKKKIILADCDGVWYDFGQQFVDILVDSYGWGPAKEFDDFTSWDFYEKLGLNEAGFEYLYEDMARNHKLFNNQECVDFSALAQLGRLREAGHEVHFVTSRVGAVSVINTTELLSKLGIAYDGLHFVQDKSIILGDYLLDDYPPHVTRFMQVNFDNRAYAYLLKRPWNADFDDNMRVGRVDTVEQFVDDVLRDNR